MKSTILVAALSLFAISRLLAQSPCDTEMHRQFDFWVGDWDVYDTTGDTVVGHNTINKILNGCVVEENWTSLGGFQGKSFNTYNVQDSTWNQVWVDVGGSTIHFKGKLEGQVMQLHGEGLTRSGNKVWYDMSYHPDPKDQSVRQIWKNSTDGGKTWNTVFDGIYRLK